MVYLNLMVPFLPLWLIYVAEHHSEFFGLVSGI